MSNMIYTGIGSRETPEEVLEWMTMFASVMEENCIKLRSGGADGADSAFEKGARREKEIFIASNGIRGRYRSTLVIPLTDLTEDKQEECANKAAGIHPAWDRCTDWAKAMHSRNILQIEGTEGVLTDFVVYWAKYDKHFNPKGGTATAVNYAKSLGIPTFNLNIPTEKNQLLDFVENEYKVIF